MNSRSLLCRYLSEHSDWETGLWEKYRLKTKSDGDYTIFNYNYDSPLGDPLVQEARGIILDTKKLEVVCWPFRKFGNYVESYADPIDWDTACVQEKIDGSIIKLWFSEREDRWIFATNSVIDAANAQIEGSCLNHTFLDVICRAENYPDLHFESLDKQKTYIFELVAPETQVIVRYEKPLLYHTGTRHNVTGEETDEEIGIIRPARYPLHSLKDCVEAARVLNSGSDTVEHEGFVVVDKDWHRVKIKNPDYLVKHKIAIVYLNLDNSVDLLINSGLTITELCDIRPNDAKVLKYYDWQIEEVLSRADLTAEMARAMDEEFSHDRKAVAEGLRGNPLAFVGFEALQSEKTGRAILMDRPLFSLKKLIKPYA